MPKRTYKRDAKGRFASTGGARKNIVAARKQRAKELQQTMSGGTSKFVYLGVNARKKAVIRLPVRSDASLVKTFGRAKNSKSGKALRNDYMKFLKFDAGKRMKLW